MADKYQIIGEMKTTDIKKGQKEILDGFDKTDKKATAFTGTLKKVGAAVVASFAVSSIVSFGRKVAETRGQFQKLQAVLENTLGSKSASQQAFRVLNQLAQQSNFGLLELTDSYVKLVNQGINPTRAEMVKLQDLANSTGKSFGQLTEAIIDAQVGEFERLKEFGIRASKEGDKVKFTFKGVQEQVDFTQDSIKKYIIGLGDLEGVTGSTEKISATLAGKISNLGDAMDTMLNKIGTQAQPILMNALNGLIEIFNYVPAILRSLQPVFNDTMEFLRLLIIDTGVLDGLWWVFNETLNVILATMNSLWKSAKAGTEAMALAMASQWGLAVQRMRMAIQDVEKDWTVNFDRMGKFYAEVMKNMTSETKKFTDFQQKSATQTATVQKESIDEVKARSIASNLSRARSLKNFAQIAIGSALDQAIAWLITDAIKKFGWFGVPLAAGAGAAARGLFSSAGIAKFAQGGVVDGNSFTGDRQLVLANSGERIMNMDQQKFMLQAGAMNAEKLDTLIQQNEQLLDAMIYGERNVKADIAISTISIVDMYDDGLKNKGLLASG